MQPRIVPLEAHADIVSQFRSGKTLQQIGTQYGVTRERIRQLLAYGGITGKHGGKAAITKLAALRRRAEQDARYLEMHGCTFAQYRYVMKATGRKAQDAYKIQRVNARSRGIAWEFNFWSWWQVWQQSGKWDERGRTSGRYVMARIGDEGPYSPTNVTIKTCNENIAEHYASALADRLPASDLIAPSMAPGVEPYRAARLAGIGYGTWSCIRKGKLKTVSREKFALLSAEFSRMAEKRPAPDQQKAA